MLRIGSTCKDIGLEARINVVPMLQGLFFNFATERLHNLLPVRNTNDYSLRNARFVSPVCKTERYKNSFIRFQVIFMASSFFKPFYILDFLL